MKAGFITRLALIEAALHPEDQWWKQDGLCALLEAAKRLPPVDPWDLPGVYEGAPGFGGLLWQAREQEHQRWGPGCLPG